MATRITSVTNRERLFEILESRKYVLALYGHNHFIEQVTFTEDMGWRGAAAFRGISTGAASGFWWGGPKDPRDIPAAYCGDGSPNGTFLFTFEGVEYGYRFVPVRTCE